MGVCCGTTGKEDYCCAAAVGSTLLVVLLLLTTAGDRGGVSEADAGPFFSVFASCLSLLKAGAFGWRSAKLSEDPEEEAAVAVDEEGAVREVGEEGGSRFITLQIQLPKSTDSCSERLMKGWLYWDWI